MFTQLAFETSVVNDGLERVSHSGDCAISYIADRTLVIEEVASRRLDLLSAEIRAMSAQARKDLTAA